MVKFYQKAQEKQRCRARVYAICHPIHPRMRVQIGALLTVIVCCSKAG